jgi:putative ABC transport system substrate-binding protein
MRRLVLIICLTALLGPASFLAPLGAQAQQDGKVYRIGVMRSGKPPDIWVAALQQGLRALGYVVGQNATIEYRFADGSLNQLPRLAEELVRLNVDVIIAVAGPAALAAQKATRSVPIVFVAVHLPVEIGLVSNLARPGGNITGLSISATDLAGKRLELLRELVPQLRRVGVLYRAANRGSQTQLKEAEAAARVLGVQVKALPISGPDDFESAFKAARDADGLLQVDDPLFVGHRVKLAELAVRRRLPAVYGFREFVESGGVMSYGPDISDLFRRAAASVDKILKGANPGDLPVEQPIKFELVINVKTAKVLGLTISPSLLLRADQVLE